MAEKVTVNIPETLRILGAKAPQATLLFLAKYAEEAAKYVEDVAIKNTPVGATGQLRESIVVEVTQPNGNFYTRLLWTAPHADAVSKGSSAHWAPIGPLKDWAGAKLGDEFLGYAVRSSIATNGTKANPFIENTQKEIAPNLSRTFEKAVIDLSAFLSGD